MEFKNYFKQLINKIALITFAILIIPAFIFAEGNNTQDSKIYHQNTIGSFTIPTVGENITLKVLLLNTNNTKSPMTAVLTHDNLMTVVKPNRVFLNQFDQVEYHFNTYAPIAKLNYQFFSETDSKEGISSKIFEIKRNCRYPIKETDSNVPNSIRGLERVQVVYEKTQSLEREVHAYDSAKKLIGNIIEELNLIKSN